MNRTVSLTEAVLSIVAQSCYMQPDELRPDMKLADLGLHSLAMTSVLAEVQAASGRDLTADEVLALFQADDLGALTECIRGFI